MEPLPKYTLKQISKEFDEPKRKTNKPKQKENTIDKNIKKNIDMLLTRTEKKKATIEKYIETHWSILGGFKLKSAKKHKIFIERVLNALKGKEHMTPDILKYCRQLIEENNIFEKHKNTPYKKLFKNKNILGDAINAYVDEQNIPTNVLSSLDNPYEFEKYDFDTPHLITIYNNYLDGYINAIDSVEMIKKFKSQKIE